MKAVFKHELSSYFSGLMGYVFCAFILAFIGIYMAMYNFTYMVTNFEYVLNGMSFVFLIIVPIITMRVIAAERKMKTDKLLYSLPISSTDIVLGKYLALIILLLIPTAIMCIYPLVLSAFGNVYLPSAYSAICGFFFLGAALISIGMFISSLTESQAVAAGVCFGIMLLNYFMNTIAVIIPGTAPSSLIAFIVILVLLVLFVYYMTKDSKITLIAAACMIAVLLIFYFTQTESFEGLFADIIKNISLFSRFNNMINGIFDISGIVYLISICFLFGALTTQSLEKRRWS